MSAWDPPALAPSAELRWVLGRAYAPVAAELRVDHPDRAVALARVLAVGTRIASRAGPEVLERELGAAAAELRRDRDRAAARELALLATAREVQAAAAEVDAPLAPLKFLGLWAAGVLPPAGRLAIDLDVLVPAASAAPLAAALGRRGFVATAPPGAVQHLPPLARDGRFPVEIHAVIPGVRLRGRRSASFADLRAAGLLEPGSEPAAGWAVPAPSVLLAHALVHGLAQHRRDATYPLTRMLADAIDLGLGNPGEAALVAPVPAWTARSLSADRLAAALALARALAAGTLDELLGEPRLPAARLLAHLVAARLDPAYADALRLSIWRQPASDRPIVAAAAAVGQTILPGRPQLEQLYGTRAGRWGGLRLRLRRLVDLVSRLRRLTRSRRAVRRARRHPRHPAV